jgi:membrane-associated phospholipid phosphatase
MNICYFSYYLITAIACIAIYILKPAASFKSIFVVICSFYLYYLMYCLLPVVGPQYYFDLSNVSAPEPLLFGKIMHYIITNFEQPTGAFPSSHVGLALIVTQQTYLHTKKLFYFLLPFAIGICFATVYLKAHYVLDVLAAFITVPLFIAISNWLYHKLQNSTQLS